MVIWGMGVMVGLIFGLMFGGWFIDSYNWCWVFFINVLIGVFVFVGVMIFLLVCVLCLYVKFDVFGFVMFVFVIGVF